MTIHDSLMKKEAKTLLALARERSLMKVGDIGRISREIESGIASEVEIWDLIKDLPEAVHLSGGKSGPTKDVDQKMLDEIVARLDKLEAYHKKGRESRAEFATVAERLEKSIAEQGLKIEKIASAAPMETPPARMDEDDIRRIVDGVMESLRERNEESLRELSRTIADQVSEGIRRIDEAVASIPEAPVEIAPVFTRNGYKPDDATSDRASPVDDLQARLADLEERVSRRPRVSVFTSRDPRFPEVTQTVRDFLSTTGTPATTSMIREKIESVHPDVDIHAKDIGNRLTNMGLARVRPDGSKQGKSSNWWLAGKVVPDGYVS